jgi:hypothetical protein
VTPDPEVLFEAQTPFGFRVRVTRERWELVVREKHPVMRGEEANIPSVLEAPEEVRQSLSDPTVYLFYKEQKPKRWLCAVSKRDGDNGFLITAYPTEAIKEGTKIWPN